MRKAIRLEYDVHINLPEYTSLTNISDDMDEEVEDVLRFGITNEDEGVFDNAPRLMKHVDNLRAAWLEMDAHHDFDVEVQPTTSLNGSGGYTIKLTSHLTDEEFRRYINGT